MEPLIKSYVNRVAGEKAADARRATMSIVKTMDEERNAVAVALVAATLWGGWRDTVSEAWGAGAAA